ncbi:MAG: hypothetical protein Q8P89_00625 [bacterium]|nr:hypothetical protein [bacterium]
MGLVLLALIAGSTVAIQAQGGTEIPATSTAPQVVVYPDPNVGQWIVKIPTDSGDVFVSAKKLSCPAAESMTLQMGDYVLNGPVILNGWTNKQGQDQGEWKLIVRSGERDVLQTIGGTLWRFADSCSDKELQGNYDQNPLKAQTLNDLRSRGLAQ